MGGCFGAAFGGVDFLGVVVGGDFLGVVFGGVDCMGVVFGGDLSIWEMALTSWFNFGC